MNAIQFRENCSKMFGSQDHKKIANEVDYKILNVKEQYHVKLYNLKAIGGNSMKISGSQDHKEYLIEGDF